jgi:murein DD-endopeptidase MepM/ murein hydrolase activator NlpD
VALAVAVSAVVLGVTTPAGQVAAAPAGHAAEPPEAPGFEGIAGQHELTSDHAKVFRLYWAFFGRSPDPGGALYWIEQRDRCLGLDTIADFFAHSDEFLGRHDRLDDRAFVEVIYRNVLSRPGDPEGLAYWTGLLTGRTLTRGGVVLNVSLSAELTARYPYPSDSVPPRSCHLLDGRPAGRSVHVLEAQPLATVAGLTIMAPAAVIERAGFHESTHPGALAMSPAQPPTVRTTTMASRNRRTHERSALDVVTEPSTTITAPVTGTVARAGGYTLYCRYGDGYVVINPDGRPDLEVKILHLQHVTVRPGQRVQAGDPVASHATTFPFRSQVDGLTAEPSWPHVHIEVVDPSAGKVPSGTC